MTPWLDDFEPGDLGADPEVAGALAALDPQSEDPNYWLRFRSWVLTNAAPELARRRLMARLTVGDVVASWARALIPTAALAAALAAMLLARSADVGDPLPIGLEELLASDIEGLRIPVVFTPEEIGARVTFASEAF